MQFGFIPCVNSIGNPIGNPLMNLHGIYSLKHGYVMTKSLNTCGVFPLLYTKSRRNCVSMSTQASESTSIATENTGMRANFIKNRVIQDLQSGKHTSILTRFPPEPNGYLHLGHAKSIVLNFELAKEFGGNTNLRFDDTNPEKEDEEYVQAIMKDVHWIAGEHGLSGDTPWLNLTYSSDFFQKMYEFAIELIRKGLAFVDELTPEEVREMRGNLTTPGIESPYRTRSVDENLELFEKMKNGLIDEGKMILRAKIDMKSSNMNMRDPALYRVKKVAHQRTGTEWVIYPMYDFAHCLSDSIEGITHSLCTLEFEEHRALYDWILDHVSVDCHPQQIEFSRLNLQYTVMSKRKLIRLVEEKYVNGWDDPRMPTICGMRRRGFTPNSLYLFADRIGVSKAESFTDYSVLEDCVREDLDHKAPRAFAVLNPIRLVITNWNKGQSDVFEAPIHPKRPEFGTRKIQFDGDVFIDGSDFMMDPPGKYFRLAPGRLVRLKFAYVVKCDEVITDESGNVNELRCTYIPETRAGQTPEGMKKVKGIIQWVNASDAVSATVRVYDRLFSVPEPGKNTEGDFISDLNPNSLSEVSAFIEPWAGSILNLKSAEPENALEMKSTIDQDSNENPILFETKAFQFERVGYFVRDPDSEHSNLILNRVVTLRDTWLK
eukprot:CAMPEP_0182447878 /NCGR_PEP_ID=MMETSP1172-20130603/21230_1 /TAXON_ID=708627 /ORGANISM="Timspurckia oligopyrenoides, Strain CCMP3278" /LENGTH=658 /DNA_ID=CAMNT_0024644507 /DNA_START=21 /DNA_END=1997 /DNA_ORIENTATION=+